MNSRQPAASAVPSRRFRHCVKIGPADLAFVQRDLLILSVLLQAAEDAISSAHATSKTSIRRAQNHLDALDYYLSQVTTSELPALRENGTTACNFAAIFPALRVVERKTKELREKLATKRGN